MYTFGSHGPERACPGVQPTGGASGRRLSAAEAGSGEPAAGAWVLTSVSTAGQVLPEGESAHHHHHHGFPLVYLGCTSPYAWGSSYCRIPEGLFFLEEGGGWDQ